HRDLDDAADGGGKIGVGRGPVVPVAREQPSPDRGRRQVEDACAKIGLRAEKAHVVDEGAKTFVRVVAGTSGRIGKTKAGVDMQVVAAELRELPRIVSGRGRVVAMPVFLP